MHISIRIILFLFSCFPLMAQEFSRDELAAELNNPWEITYGPDGYLWLTEAFGTVSRVDPITGEKIVIFEAYDYYLGSPLEDLPGCDQPIGHGTLGLALHPDFLEEGSSLIYFVYSYNSGTDSLPSTKFRVKQLTWDLENEVVLDDTNLINDLPTGHDHLGGRLIAVKQAGNPYLFLSIGDHGRSEDNNPTCYDPPSSNPNNLTQDPNYQNGKIHRFNLDGTIPDTNPIAGNSFYTRGHRNPQGLTYNPSTELLYSIEHGDRTDDEINILEKGMNYGWKQVRGYHDDNIENEMNFLANYEPHPAIANDELKEAFYSWCTGPTPADSVSFLQWCTVAPSDGIYYGSEGIAEWTNSLLVVTLKNGDGTKREVYQFQLNENGTLVESTPQNLNPKRFFGDQQGMNGRLRDITYSPDGKTIFLINNGGADRDKITTYTLMPTSNNEVENLVEKSIKLYPNPIGNTLFVEIPQLDNKVELKVYNLIGNLIFHQIIQNQTFQLDVKNWESGCYWIQVSTKDNSLWKQVSVH